MPKSLRLSGKFNAEEAEIIKKFQGRHKIKPNQLVRKAVINYVELHMGIEALSSHPKFVKFFKQYMKDLETWNEGRNTLKKLENYLSIDSDRDMLEFQASFEKIENTAKILEKKKKPGRPKEKRRPGRPKKR